jgi:hypothetical protein
LKHPNDLYLASFFENVADVVANVSAFWLTAIRTRDEVRNEKKQQQQRTSWNRFENKQKGRERAVGSGAKREVAE